MHESTTQPNERGGATLLGPGSALLTDAASWTIGLVLAVWGRYELSLTRANLVGALSVAVLACAAQALIGHTQYLYRGRHPFGTFAEVPAVTATVLATAGVVLTVDLALPTRPVPASTPVIGGLLALVLMLGCRYVHRLLHERSLRPRGPAAAPALLFGAGAAGHDLTRAILRDPTSAYTPAGILDDDPRKRHLRVHGVPVLGGRHDLPAAVARTGATTVIFSVANADAELIREVQRISLQAGTAFKVVPSVAELLDGRAGVGDVRDVRITDLLGRRQIETDLVGVADALAGKRILVTGAGGSIGSELCRQLHRLHPSELMMLDRDESALHAVQLDLHGRALLDDSELILADLRDADALRHIFATRQPQVVFHAAALKHLSLLQRNPGEAVKTNVWGTQNVLEQAWAWGVEKFVNISTDKAANPSSVLGYSKRITERLTAYAATRTGAPFLSVRFGNVLGSRGSVLTIFNAQAAAGGPITVTHPDVTRYFMTVQEAVQLVLAATAVGRGGEALVLDMGRPVRIGDVARQIADQAAGLGAGLGVVRAVGDLDGAVSGAGRGDTSTGAGRGGTSTGAGRDGRAPASVASQGGRRMEIVYTGLRPGEKLHEELFGADERDVRPCHPLISHVPVPPLHPRQARALDPTTDPEEIISALARTCATDATLPYPAAASAGSVAGAGAAAAPAGLVAAPASVDLGAQVYLRAQPTGRDRDWPPVPANGKTHTIPRDDHPDRTGS